MKNKQRHPDLFNLLADNLRPPSQDIDQDTDIINRIQEELGRDIDDIGFLDLVDDKEI